MERSNIHFRHSLLFLFDSKKSAADAYQHLVEVYGKKAPSYPNCRFWFQRFKKGNFDVNDKERSGQPKKFNDHELQALLDSNPAQTLKELAGQLNVTEMTVSNRLRKMGKVRNNSKWVPRERVIGKRNFFSNGITKTKTKQNHDYIIPKHQIIHQLDLDQDKETTEVKQHLTDK